MIDGNTPHDVLADRIGLMVMGSCTCGDLRSVGQHDDDCPTDALREAAVRIRTIEQVGDHMIEQGTRMAGLEIKSQKLVDRAKILVEKLDRAETHEGGLLTVDMLTAKNQLRLELSRWK